MPSYRMTRLAILTSASLLASIAYAQDEATEPERCISLNRVDHTTVVDDETILFHMLDGSVYRNVLPHGCPGLDDQQPFMYRTTVGRLCSVDVVTVLEDVGFDFVPGASCGLGEFQSIGPDTVETLTAD